MIRKSTGIINRPRLRRDKKHRKRKVMKDSASSKGDFLQSFDIRNKKGISAGAVLGIILLAAGLAGHLHLLDAVFGAETGGNPFLYFAPNYKTGLVYALIGAALLISGLIPDKYSRLDLYTDALVLYRKESGENKSVAYADAVNSETGETYLFDDIDAIVASQRGLGDPRSLLIIPEEGRKIQIMVPPRNEMPAEVEGVWRSYCVRYNRELERSDNTGEDSPTE